MGKKKTLTLKEKTFFFKSSLTAAERKKVQFYLKNHINQDDIDIDEQE